MTENSVRDAERKNLPQQDGPALAARLIQASSAQAAERKSRQVRLFTDAINAVGSQRILQSRLSSVRTVAMCSMLTILNKVKSRG